MEGIVQNNGVVECAECGKEIDIHDGNFCSNCGNPLNDLAVALKDEQIIAVKLEVLSGLIYHIKDVQALNIIKDKIKEISNIE